MQEREDIVGIMAEIDYSGELRTQATHLASGHTQITDAPIDNHGKGQAFSPTDNTAVSLATCMLTVMGIHASKIDMELPHISAVVKKVMASDPRRISSIQVRMTFASSSLTEKEKVRLEKMARTCPVARSLHPDIEQIVEFDYE